MIDSNEMAQSIIETLMDRGTDFIIEEARKFVEENDLKKLSSNQMNSLKSAYEKESKCYAKKKSEVKEFIDKQKEKDEKQKGGKWSNLGDKLYKRIFEFSPSERIRVWEIIENICEMPNKVKADLEEKFDPDLPESNEWLEETLDPLLSHRIFNAVYTYHRCKSDGLSIPEIKE